MSSFLTTNTTPRRQSANDKLLSPSPARRAQIAHPETNFSSPDRTREARRQAAEQVRQQKRVNSFMSARGGLDSMADDVMRAEYQQDLEAMEQAAEKQARIGELRPEDFEEDTQDRQVKNHNSQSENDYYEIMIQQQEEELNYLADMEG